MAEFLPIDEKDLPVIKEIYDHYILNSTATFHSRPVTVTELKELLNFPRRRYPAFTIRAGGKIIGYCFLTRYKNREAYDRTAELSIYLRPECTGKGIGPAALRHLEKAAKRSGIHVLIGTLCGENTQSIRLMETAGYSRAARLKNVGEKFGKVLDVVIYQKEI